MKKQIVLSLLLSILISSISLAEWFPGNSNVSAEFDRKKNIEIQMLNNYECEILITFPGIKFDNDLIEKLSVKGLTNVGGIPVVSGFLSMPSSSDMEVQVLSDSNYGYQITDEALIQLCNELTPVAGEKFDSGVFSFGIPGIFRDLRIIPVNLRPFDFDPVTNVLKVTSEVRLRITFPQGTSSSFGNGLRKPSRVFQDIYRDICWNYVDGGTDDFEPANYLILCPDNFAGYLQPLVDWKNQKGVRTELVTFSEINPLTVTDVIIKNYLSLVYNTTTTPPDYVLLVGDEINFPIHMAYTNDPPTPFSSASFPGYYVCDDYFAWIDGEDYYPEYVLGRICTHEAENAIKIVNKIVNYEKNPNMIQTDWYGKAVVCADIADPTQRTTKITVQELMLEEGGFTTVDSLFGGNQPSLFVNWVNSGKSFINYRGTGWSFGWAGLNVYVQNISNLINYNKLSIVTGIGCGVAGYSEGTPCFGETWMNSGTPSTPSGAVAFYGPTWNTHTEYNNNLDIGIYESLILDSTRNIGAAAVAGKMFVESQFAPYIQAYSSVYEVVETMFGQYTLLSDPELVTRASIPRTIVVDHADSIAAGENDLQVSVEDESGIPVEGVMVCAYIENEVFSVDLTDASGLVDLLVNSQTLPNDLTITVTGIDINSYSQSIPVYAEGEFISLTDYEIDDGGGGNLLSPGETVDLSAQVQNFGTEPASGVWGILAAGVEGVTFENDSVYFGEIAVGEEIWGGENFRFGLSPDYTSSVLPMSLYFHDAESNAWMSTLEVDVYAPIIVYSHYNLNPGPDSVLERGGEADITIAVQNIGVIDVADMVGTLESLSPEVQIIEGEINYGYIQQGQLFENLNDPFVFLVDAACPANFTASFRFTLSGNQGSFNYEMSAEFEIIVGEPVALDPGVDYQGLYYAYESRDVTYLQAPEYSWTEISPQAGGNGTEIVFDEQTGVAYLDMPFNWVFYGEEMDMITVSEDGFINPGSLPATSPINWGFPRMDMIDGMIAPLWDDLKCIVFEPGDVSWLYDPLTGAFIIEYFEWTHSLTNVYPETFQVIIYDPEVRVTQTGNSEIEFVYKEITPMGKNFSSCGIEAPDQSDGIEIWQNSLVPATSWGPESNTKILITTESPVFVSVAEEEEIQVLPETVFLNDNYPNPFNPTTSFRFGMPEGSEVHLEVYNIMGRKVATLIDGFKEAGVHRVVWNAHDNATGIYFARLNVEGQTRSVKCLLIK